MSKKVTRRDFLNGIALGASAAAVALSPFGKLAFSATEKISKIDGVSNPNYYPPALTGLRGNAPGTFNAAHQLMRGEEEFHLPNEVNETYDLVVVGAGISGLAAAYFYQKKHNNKKRVLILDNSDDFGGHAVRNEFTTDEGLLIGYGGSESLQSPRSIFSPIAHGLMKDLGVNYDRLESSFDVNLYPNMGLSKAVFFDKENWGVNKIVAGDPGFEVADDIPRDRLNGRPYEEFIADFPMNETDQKALIELFNEKIDYLSDLSIEEKKHYLDSTSYEDFLRKRVKLSDTAIKFFKQQTSEFQGVGIDATPCSDARLCALPGFEAMNLPPMDAESQAELDDPYLFHFPDGNASLARLMVRKLIPEVAAGNTMEDIVLANFNYHELDVENRPTRLRLNSTVINAQNNSDNSSADLVYANGDDLYRVRAKSIIMANYNMMIPYIVPSMPEKQKDALAENIKVPFVYAKLAIKNWNVFKKLGIHKVYSPTAPFCLTKLDYPVSIGGYTHSTDPNSPISLHMVYVPTDGKGVTAREKAIEGRKKIVRMKFEEFEDMIRSQLNDMFGEHGFNHEEDITDITVNRWGHGYSYTVNTLFDNETEAEKTMITARQPFGRIFIANSDSHWDPYAHAGIDAAHRAVEEL